MSVALVAPTAKVQPSRSTSAIQLIGPKVLLPQTLSGDVQARAQARLRACPYREIRKTTCLFHKGVLRLSGDVSSFYMKQIAQTILKNIEGVKFIVNTIHVRTADRPRGAHASCYFGQKRH